MPVVEARVVVPLDVRTAFWVSQTQGEVRYRWDNFVRNQRLVDAESPAKKVRTVTRSRHGLRMLSEYVSFAPPTNVGMKMITGPWFFEHFGAGWRFQPGPQAGTTEAVWRYNFTVRPAFLRPIGDRLGKWLLGADIRRRIAGYANGCRDQVVVTAARAAATGHESARET